MELKYKEQNMEIVREYITWMKALSYFPSLFMNRVLDDDELISCMGSENTIKRSNHRNLKAKNILLH